MMHLGGLLLLLLQSMPIDVEGTGRQASRNVVASHILPPFSAHSKSQSGASCAGDTHTISIIELISSGAHREREHI